MERTETNEFRFAELIASVAKNHEPRWAQNGQTTLAYGTGRLPEHVRQIGWQPLAGPGSPPAAQTHSTSIRSLRRRIARGEA